MRRRRTICDTLSTSDLFLRQTVGIWQTYVGPTRISMIRKRFGQLRHLWHDKCLHLKFCLGLWSIYKSCRNSMQYFNLRLRGVMHWRRRQNKEDVQWGECKNDWWVWWLKRLHIIHSGGVNSQHFGGLLTLIACVRVRRRTSMVWSYSQNGAGAKAAQAGNVWDV